MSAVLELFVPGRVCLFGEHSDWAAGYRRLNSAIRKGYTIITGTNQGLYARVKAHSHSLVFRSTTDSGQQTSCELAMDPALLKSAAEEGGFFSYVAGVAYQMVTHYHVEGIEIDNYTTDLPIGKGLSSSAAVCVLTARAFNRVYDLKMTIRGEMEMAYRGETTTPSRCGRMDQGCAYGHKPILMTYDADALEVEELALEDDLHYVIVDLGGQKDTVKILADLNRAFPFADSEQDRKVQQYLGQINEEIVLQAREALETARAEQLGTLMNDAQGAFDSYAAPACPTELAAPALHKILAAPELKELSWGGKGVGSQGDGAAQLLARDAQAQSRIIEILHSRYGLAALALTVPGIKRVRTAVITAAGAGTRLFPVTKLIRKEFMPVVDAAGRLVPLLLKHLLELDEAGIEQIFIVIRASEEASFRNLVLETVDPDVFQHLSRENQQLARKLEAVAPKIRLVPQPDRKGLGSAVLAVRELVGAEPFLLVLGDHYFVSGRQSSCCQQLLEAYGHVDGSIIGIAETDERDIHRFGTVGGAWERDGALLSISRLIEKPSVEEAQERLRISGLSRSHYYTVFGLYVLAADIMGILAEMVSEQAYGRGELQLTDALERLRRTRGLFGLPIVGKKVDIGVPSDYTQALHDSASRGASTPRGSTPPAE